MAKAHGPWPRSRFKVCVSVAEVVSKFASIRWVAKVLPGFEIPGRFGAKVANRTPVNPLAGASFFQHLLLQQTTNRISKGGREFRPVPAGLRNLDRGWKFRWGFALQLPGAETQRTSKRMPRFPEDAAPTINTPIH